jgi:hypothetical protein
MTEIAIRELSDAEIEFVSGGNWFAPQERGTHTHFARRRALVDYGTK